MDPLSVTAGVVGIVDFAGKVIAACTTFISAIKDAPAELFLIRAEVETLQAIVRSLDLPQGPGLPARGNSDCMRALRLPGGTLDQCRTSLEELLHVLIPTARPNVSRPFGPARAMRGPSRLSAKFSAFRLASLVSSKRRNDRETQKLYDDLAWRAFDLATWPSKLDKAKALREKIMQHKTTIALALEVDTRNSIATVIEQLNQLNMTTAQQVQNRDVKAEILRWLKAPDMFQRQLNVAAGRFPGTCSWIFTQPAYVHWATKGGLLWISAIAGYGKSTLMSGIVQQLSLEILAKQPPTPLRGIYSPWADRRRCVLLHFYFNGDDQGATTTTAFICSFLAQIAQEFSINSEEFLELFGAEGVTALQSFQPAAPAILEKALCKISAAHDIILVVDGLDECEDIEQLLALIGRVRKTSISVLISSRPSALITAFFDRMANKGSEQQCAHLTLSPEMNRTDIETYVTQTVDTMVSDHHISLRDLTLRDEIIRVLVQRSDGMFQWAVSHLRELPSYFTDHDILEALRGLLSGLEGTYEYMMNHVASSIPPRNLRLLRRVFRMLLFAQRQLTLPELAVGVSIEPGQNQLNLSTIMTNPQNILTLGGSLIVYHPESDTVQFRITPCASIFSPPLTQPSCLGLLTRTSTQSLRELVCAISNLMKLSAHSALLVEWMGEEHSPLPLMPQHFGSNTPNKLRNPESELLPTFFMISSLHKDGVFIGGRPALSLHGTLMGKGAKPPRMGNRTGNNQETACVGALTGCLISSTSHWLSGPASDRPDIDRLTPFHYLARINHPECLARALEGDTGYINYCMKPGGPLGTVSLHEAAKYKAFEFAQVLLNYASTCINIDQSDILGHTALFYACQSGTIHLVRMLLQHGASPALQDWYGSTALHEAVRHCHLGVVEYLLACGDISQVIDVADKAGNTALMTSIRLGRLDIASLLFHRSSGRTVVRAMQLIISCPEGLPQGMLRAMMEGCLHVRWDSNVPPLQRLMPGMTDIDLCILERMVAEGYPVDLEDSRGNTALTDAIRWGYWRFSDHLLRLGASLPKALNNYMSPKGLRHLFMQAVEGGGFRLALGLLNSGVPWDGKDRKGRPFIFTWANRITKMSINPARPVDEQIDPAVTLLEKVVQRGMDINITDGKGRNLLHLLSLYIGRPPLQGWLPQVLLSIISLGCDPAVHDTSSSSPLHYFCEEWDAALPFEMLEILQLMAAPEAVRATINDLLLTHGSITHLLVHWFFDFNVTLYVAYFLYHVLPLVLRAGASLSIQNHRGQTPLDVAAERTMNKPLKRDPETVSLLLRAIRALAPEDPTCPKPMGLVDYLLEICLPITSVHQDLAITVYKLDPTPEQYATLIARTTGWKDSDQFPDSGLTTASVTHQWDQALRSHIDGLWRRGSILHCTYQRLAKCRYSPFICINGRPNRLSG